MAKRVMNKGLRALGAGALVLAASAFAGVSGAGAAVQPTGLYITGAGYGHGIGMSQYGAAGFAEHGYSYAQILSHYYQDTTLGQVSPTDKIRVLLKQGAATFRGADTQLGPKTTLNPGRTYSVIPHKGKLLLMSGGKRYGVWPAPLTVSGSGPLTVPGMGEYRGQLEFVPAAKGGGLDTINIVGIEDYVRGVVPAEMPSTWPAQALAAQAVAARSYAVADSSVSSLFDVYDDTRSQMYGGVGAETPAADAAVAATAGKVVQYGGQPAITYFFSSSGGYTESIQNVWVGVTPEAWLHGVPDPYDDSLGNPYYRWKDTMSVATAAQKLHRYVKGSLTGIKVIRHGVSPRVVKAEVIGTKGSVDVTGQTLQNVLGLRSTYMSFKIVTHHRGVSSGSGAGGSGGAAGSGSGSSGTSPESSPGSGTASGSKSGSGTGTGSGSKSGSGSGPGYAGPSTGPSKTTSTGPSKTTSTGPSETTSSGTGVSGLGPGRTTTSSSVAATLTSPVGSGVAPAGAGKLSTTAGQTTTTAATIATTSTSVAGSGAR